MKRIALINTKRALAALARPLKKKGIIIQPESDAEAAVKTGVKVANRGIRAANQLIAESEKLVEKGRDALHKATAPKPRKNSS
jgi:hypothetical protein